MQVVNIIICKWTHSVCYTFQTYVVDGDFFNQVVVCWFQKYIDSGFDVYALGASTKGNVLLQWLEIDQNMIQSVGDVNSRKFGKQTPGTCIPIIPENEILNLAKENVIAIVLPWHFRQGIVGKSQQFMQSGGALLFPLPQIEVVSI